MLRTGSRNGVTQRAATVRTMVGAAAAAIDDCESKSRV